VIFPSGISTYDYSQTLAQRGWSKGWPACLIPLPFGLGVQTRNITLKKSGTVLFNLDVRIADLKELLFNEIERRGYLLHPGWCWGGECRSISGTSVPSNHSFYCATDLNAPNNSYNSTGQHDIPEWAFALLRAYGFSLGADYTGGKKDWMHVEFLGTPDDAAAMTALARRAFLNPPAPKPAPKPAPDKQTAPTEDDDMAAQIVSFVDDKTKQYVVDFAQHTVWHIPDEAQCKWLMDAGLKVMSGSQDRALINGYKEI
jgi:hypothetical protein